MASGDPLTERVVLWTRLAPEPLTASGGIDGVGNVRVRWEVAEDEGMRRVVRSGRASPPPTSPTRCTSTCTACARAGSTGTGSPSATGRRPPPAPAPRRAGSARVDAVRFAFCTCQKWEDGFYTAFGHLAEEDLDIVFHLGDYTYEYGIDPATGGARGVTLPDEYADETVTLDQFRLRHSLYKTDPDLQLAHARFPWVVTWDDHEVDNDYTADIPEDGTPPDEFRLRRIAGYQAFYEHLPLRAVARPDRNGEVELYRAITWGRLAEFDVVDTRQYRSDHPCGDGEHARCDASFDPAQTMLGGAQERWLDRRLRRSDARWSVLANQVMVAELDHDPGAGTIHWQDSWDGYPVARQRLLEFVHPAAQPGRHHRRLALDVRQRPQVRLPRPSRAHRGDRDHRPGDHLERRRSGVRPVLRPDGGVEPAHQVLRRRPQGVRPVCADEDRLTADIRYVDYVGSPGGGVSTAATFAVEDGHPGAVSA